MGVVLADLVGEGVLGSVGEAESEEEFETDLCAADSVGVGFDIVVVKVRVLEASEVTVRVGFGVMERVCFTVFDPVGVLDLVGDNDLETE